MSGGIGGFIIGVSQIGGPSVEPSQYPNTYLPLQVCIPSYLYLEYNDDENLQAFVDSYNVLSQSYLDWFNDTPLAVYTSSGISGPLLDWIANGIYGIPRPVLSSQQTLVRAGYNEFAYNVIPYNGLTFSISGTASLATDDIYKRVMTWNLYRGDGQQFSLFWLKRRVARFLNGVNGADVNVLNFLPSITLSGHTFTISAAISPAVTALQQCLASGALVVPFQYEFVISDYLLNDGGVLQVLSGAAYPTSSSGLPNGAVWSNGGVVSVVPGITPDPTAPPVFFGAISAGSLLALGGGNLPTTNPGVGIGQLWNNGGVVSIS